VPDVDEDAGIVIAVDPPLVVTAVNVKVPDETTGFET